MKSTVTQKRQVSGLLLSIVLLFTTQEMLFAQNVGIGILTPKVKLHVVDGSITGGMGMPYETIVSERTTDAKTGVYCTSTSPLNLYGAAVTLGYSNYTNTAGFYPGFEMQYGQWSGPGFLLRFNALARNVNGTYNVPNTYQNVLVMSHTGMVGINLTNGAGIAPVAPTANLHVNGSVRFQNLPSGGGNYLVVDANGNLRVSANSITTRIPDGNETALLKQEIILLKEQIDSMQATIQNMSGKLETLLK